MSKWLEALFYILAFSFVVEQLIFPSGKMYEALILMFVIGIYIEVNKIRKEQ